MIDEQHPMQIGMFPMDIKCQQQQQPPQQQHIAHNQQQQQQQAGLVAMCHNQLPMLNGNERMLTTAATTTAGAGTTTSTQVGAMGLGSQPLNNKHGELSTTTTATTSTAACHNDKMATASRNVNGSCSNHNSSSSSSNNNNINNGNKNKTNVSNNNGHVGMPTHACVPGPGPGPPMQHQQQQHPLCNRVTLGECSLNGLATSQAPQMLLPPAHMQHQPQQHQHQHQQQQQLQHMVGLNGLTGLSPPFNQCAYCCQPICDRYIMRVADNSFHESCLKCATCSLHLVHSCYARDGKLYCRIDYERIYLRNRCLGCGHKISPDELVMRAHENVFHLKCFACVVCGSLLKKGEQYVVKQGQLFCRFDYEKEVEMLQGYDYYGDDLFPPKLDGRRGPKRPRTILNTQQRRAFKASFEVSPKPCRKVRENLAKETGLSLRIVQVWFQNQRAKVKKIQKKAKQDPPAKGVSDSQDSQESQDSSLTKIKDEAQSDSESQLESPYSTTSDSLTKLRCNIKDEQEQMPFNCMETNKENCNKNNEPILNTILGLSYATFQQLMGPFAQTPMINPIDRLYSMQSSYFRPEELNAYGECGSKDQMEH